MGKVGLEELQLWQKARYLAVGVCKELIPGLPPEEKYCLAIQLRRAVQSIPANIAEAYGRYHSRDVIRVLHIARGSLEETRSHLFLARDLGYMDTESHQSYEGQIREIARMLNGYIEYHSRMSRPNR